MLHQLGVHTCGVWTHAAEARSQLLQLYQAEYQQKIKLHALLLQSAFPADLWPQNAGWRVTDKSLAQRWKPVSVQINGTVDLSPQRSLAAQRSVGES
jgi:hypothetical protein